ncbi:MAG TPA: MlaD family protein, partial [Solirubrobacteraceae bacterium]|nr:MlaD family protein [Solirubrobacteraceae bacterium]
MATESGARGGDKAEALTREGLELEQQGDLEGAERAYRKADELGHAGASFRLGMVLSQRDDWDGAREAWARAEDRGHKPSDWGLPAQPPSSAASTTGDTASPFANPVLIGAVTVLVLIVGVFLAYNANLGLPFLPTRELKVNIANGSNLVVGNDVREGGYYVGLISGMAPVKLAGGGYGAQLTLKLDQFAGPIPVNSHAVVYSKSALGLKYLDLIKGNSRRTFANGSTMSVAQTAIPVQIDQVFDMFNQP